MTERSVIHRGDCLEILKTLESGSVDALVTDPPAGISFMGAAWDGDKGGRDQWIAWLSRVMFECKRVLKPGGHAIVWSLPRTQHWTAMAIENAGFEIRDCLVHVFATGFPKSLDVSKAIDARLGAKRKSTGYHATPAPARIWDANVRGSKAEAHERRDDPATAAAAAWRGWGTALKPAQESWILARVPMEEDVASNVMKHGVGGINIDACRVQHLNREDFAKHKAGVDAIKARGGRMQNSWKNSSDLAGASDVTSAGRWPPNLVLSHTEDCKLVGVKVAKTTKTGLRQPGLGYQGIDREEPYLTTSGTPTGEEEIGVWECADGCPVTELDAQSGNRPGMSGGGSGRRDVSMFGVGGVTKPETIRSDDGGVSRFFPCFYQPKPATIEREGGLGDRVRTVVGAYAGGGPEANDDLSKRFTKETSNIHPCLRRGSLVLTDRGWRAIERVKLGERVLSADGTFREVLDVSSHAQSGPLFRIEVTGRSVDATGNHPFLVLRGRRVLWVVASEIRVGDFALSPLPSGNEQSTVKPWVDEGRGVPTQVAKGPRAKRATTGSTAEVACEWPMSSRGNPSTGPSRLGSKSTIATRTSKTTTCRTSSLSVPLCTSGCTLVASSAPVRGGSHAGCAVCVNQSHPITGTSLARAISPSGDASLATSQRLSTRSDFALHRVERIEQVPYRGRVWNLTVEGSPTFQTEVGMSHNTVKPVGLMRWFIRLVTPKGGLVLDPFTGSGTTGIAALKEGCRFVGIEMDEVFQDIASKRIERWHVDHKRVRDVGRKINSRALRIKGK